MSLFKFRKKEDSPEHRAEVSAESVELLRRRARHRLIGSAVLVTAGIVVFPILFETQPRPIPVDIPIDIPDKTKVKPLPAPAPAAPASPVATAPAPEPAAAPAPPAVAAAPVAKPAEAPVARPAEKPAEKPVEKAADKATDKPVAKADTKPEPKPESKPVAKPEARADDGARAQALLEGKPAAASPPADAGGGRFVVQVGAYTEPGKVREVRQKLDHAGYKNYTQDIEGKEGKRTRVRVGPFPTKAEADQVAAKIKAMNLPAAILAL